MTILVVGSFMMDHVISTPRAPINGETIVGHNYDVMAGGKGANQAVAAARLGEDVIIVGKVGKDDYGSVFLEILNNEGVNTSNVKVDDKVRTGVGFVTTEDNGDNRIIVISGANMSYNSRDLSTLEIDLSKISLVMFQLEMDFDLTVEAIDFFYRHKVPILLNPAPGRELTQELLSKITYLTPNESELEILAKRSIHTIEDTVNAAKLLLENGTENLIITLGDKGALVVNKEMTELIQGYNVAVVNTVAAGDSFNGAFAVGLNRGYDLLKATKYANVVGALTITKNGAIPSIPSIQEVDQFMLDRNIVI